MVKTKATQVQPREGCGNKVVVTTSSLERVFTAGNTGQCILNFKSPACIFRALQ